MRANVGFAANMFKIIFYMKNKEPPSERLPHVATLLSHSPSLSKLVRFPTGAKIGGVREFALKTSAQRDGQNWP